MKSTRFIEVTKQDKTNTSEMIAQLALGEYTVLTIIGIENITIFK